MRYDELRHLVDRRPSSYWIDHSSALHRLAERFRLPVDLLIEYIVSGDGKTGNSKALAKLTEKLGAAIPEQVLFLPTYRRIERELSFIFPEFDADRAMRVHNRSTEESPGYVELVEFGMRDVVASLKKTMRALDMQFRADLNRLTGEYLRGVIRGEHKKVALTSLLGKGVRSKAERVLSRIDDQILTQRDRDSLRELVRKIDDTQRIRKDDQVVAHFLSKLIDVNDKQQAREQPVHSFVKTCNKYLSGKSFMFDPGQFDVGLFLREAPGILRLNSPLSLNELSSGEKQIVSLFSHLFLTGSDGYIVIIDEPELSISVPWQRTFLVDIWDTGLCSALFAVTHSPFIFENSLEPFTGSMEQFTSMDQFAQVKH